MKKVQSFMDLYGISLGGTIGPITTKAGSNLWKRAKQIFRDHPEVNELIAIKSDKRANKDGEFYWFFYSNIPVSSISHDTISFERSIFSKEL